MTDNKPKLCYVFPEHAPSGHTHFSYNARFIEAITHSFNVMPIAERGVRGARIGSSGGHSIAVARFSFLPLRFLELLGRFLVARARGWRTFYIHYSFLAAFTAALVARATGGVTFYWNCGEPWKYKRNFMRDFFERLTYRLISYFVTGTEGMGRAYAARYPIPSSRIRVIPNWVDVREFRSGITHERVASLRRELGIKNNERVVLFVHRLSRRKGAHILPEIVEGLRDERAVVVVVGDGQERAAIEAEFKRRGLDGRVRMRGWVAYRDLPAYYGLADVFIMPSEEEGFPHVLLEAMAAGVPFVASDVGGVREIVPPSLLESVVSIGNRAAVVEKASAALRMTPGAREEFRRTEMNWVDRFDIARACGIFASVVTRP